MSRIFLGFVLAPVLASFFFGILFFIFLLIAWLTCLLIAWPLFILFSRRGWLKCWQVTTAGAACGLALLTILLVGDGLYSTIQGPANIAMFSGAGAFIAYSFWWIGLYQNKYFSEKSGHSLISAFAPLPVLLGIGLLYELYSPSLVDAFAVDKAEAMQSGQSTINIRLKDGAIASAELSDSAKMPDTDEKLTVETRRNATLIGRRYWVIARSKNLPAK